MIRSLYRIQGIPVDTRIPCGISFFYALTLHKDRFFEDVFNRTACRLHGHHVRRAQHRTNRIQCERCERMAGPQTCCPSAAAAVVQAVSTEARRGAATAPEAPAAPAA